MVRWANALDIDAGWVAKGQVKNTSPDEWRRLNIEYVYRLFKVYVVNCFIWLHVRQIV